MNIAIQFRVDPEYSFRPGYASVACISDTEEETHPEIRELGYGLACCEAMGQRIILVKEVDAVDAVQAASELNQFMRQQRDILLFSTDVTGYMRQVIGARLPIAVFSPTVPAQRPGRVRGGAPETRYGWPPFLPAWEAFLRASLADYCGLSKPAHHDFIHREAHQFFHHRDGIIGWRSVRTPVRITASYEGWSEKPRQVQNV